MKERAKLSQVMKKIPVQYQNLLENQQVTPPPGKRLPQTRDSILYQDTIRKIPHLNHVAYQNQGTVKAQKSIKLSTQQQDLVTPSKQKSTVEISNIPLRQKFKHLLPDYQKTILPYQHQILIKIQKKVDQHLQFYRQIRGKKKGILASQMRQNIAQSAHFLIDLTQLKQINYLVPQFYSFSQQKLTQDKYDVRIEMNQAIQPSLIKRKKIFRQRIYNYLKQRDGLSLEGNKFVTIPQKKFTPDNEYKNNQEKNAKFQQLSKPKLCAAVSDKKPIKIVTERMNPFDVLNKDLCGSFKQRILKQIRQKQQRLRELQKQKDRRANQFNKDEILGVLDKVHMSYLSKGISNMFKTSLLQSIQKKSLLNSEILHKLLSIIIRKGEQTGYVKIINHRQGTIIQIQKKQYTKIRTSIQEQQVFLINQNVSENEQSVVVSNPQEKIGLVEQDKEKEEYVKHQKSQILEKEQIIFNF